MSYAAGVSPARLFVASTEWALADTGKLMRHRTGFLGNSSSNYCGDRTLPLVRSKLRTKYGRVRPKRIWQSNQNAQIDNKPGF
jgi:hypothetical protein